MRGALTLFALVLLAGCGGGGGGEDFPRSATAVCEQANQRITELGTPASFTETQLYARQAKDAVGDEIDAFENLEPPAEDADAVDLYLETLRERERLLANLAEAADATSMDDVREVGSQIAALDATAREQGTAAGIAACEPK
ncbi:MAG: hypothetical protein ACYC1P_04190 [Gaiellaceae bacterium]